MMDRRAFLVATMRTAAGAVVLGACRTATDQTASGPTTATATGATGVVERPVLVLPGEDVGFPSPFAYRRGPGYIKMSHIYDTLVWKDASGEHLPWLAESFEQSDDARTYTFTLRPRLVWHDGEPLTAEDVAFTFDYFRSQPLSPEVIAQPLPEIEDVRAVGERTVEFRLAAPLAPFLGFGGVGSIPIVPQHIWSSVNDASKEQNPAVLVGSGPYRLESYSQGEGSYVYAANDDFFLGTPFVRRLEFRPVGDELAALQAGAVHAASARGARPAVLAPFRDNPAMEVLKQPPGNFGSGLYWNLARGGALADVRFRRACAHAIDREDMVQRLFGGNATAGNPGWVPPGNPFHVEVEQYRFDRGAAESLLDSAGYTRSEGGGVRRGPDGQPLAFSLLVTGRPSPVTELVVGSLKAVGVELTPQSLDTPAFNQRVIAGETEMSIIGFGGMNTDNAPEYLRQVYASGTKITQHAQGYVNPEVDRLADLQNNQTDRDERMETVARIQRIVAEDLPILPLVYPDGFTIFDRNEFDAWYYTEGGIAGTIPLSENKHAFVTGERTGLKVRSAG